MRGVNAAFVTGSILGARAAHRYTRGVQDILLATNNPGKVEEFRRLLAGSGLKPVTPKEAGIALEVDEPGATYHENAIRKATAFALAGNCVALADDSGIEVDALGGRPGVRSARYGGPSLDDRGRVAHMLREMDSTPEAERGATYQAVVAIAWPDGDVRCFEGSQRGSIARAPRGQNGFGYDPIFLNADGRTNAELSAAEKDAVSHRGEAVRAAVAFLTGSDGTQQS